LVEFKAQAKGSPSSRPQPAIALIQRVPPKYVDLNRRAFQAGRAAI
jgi:hypothetical protein